MKGKDAILRTLREEFDRWEALLAGLSEEQIRASLAPWRQSVKDVVAHLYAWQQISNARLEAAHANRVPAFPDWVGETDPDAEEELDGLNARIYAKYKHSTWDDIYPAWREGFLKLIGRAETLPEADAQDKRKFAWMKGYSINDVLESSYRHHHEEHLEPLLAWLRQKGLAEG
ncbi:MAG: ClbS/DfsB family four-helix bundle protein [Anaerolineales bacterium]|nr:ClbS/DfsB family four-helix bundle protein [Anaerolineales bacterium]